MKCFIPGCTAPIVGKSGSLGSGCERHLAQWRKSAARVISKDKSDPGRSEYALASFVRQLVAEQHMDQERVLARQAERDAAAAAAEGVES